MNGMEIKRKLYAAGFTTDSIGRFRSVEEMLAALDNNHCEVAESAAAAENELKIEIEYFRDCEKRLGYDAAYESYTQAHPCACVGPRSGGTLCPCTLRQAAARACKREDHAQ